MSGASGPADRTVAVHAVVEGQAGAPVVVLTGSLGSDLSMWDPQVAALTPFFRVVRYDTRGHGRSPVLDGPYDIGELAQDLLALLDRLGVQQASVCGLSLGGMTAMEVAARAPERVDRLVLMCTSTKLPPAQGWLDRAALVRAEGTQAVAESVVERWFTPELAARDGELIARMRAIVAATPAEGYAGCCEAIAALDLDAALKRISAPTLVISGAEDPATPPPHGEAIAAGISDSRHVVLSPAAHMANIEQAEAVNRLLLEHLRA